MPQSLTRVIDILSYLLHSGLWVCLVFSFKDMEWSSTVSLLLLYFFECFNYNWALFHPAIIARLSCRQLSILDATYWTMGLYLLKFCIAHLHGLLLWCRLHLHMKYPKLDCTPSLSLLPCLLGKCCFST